MVVNSITPNKMSLIVCGCEFSASHSPGSGYSSVYDGVTSLCTLFFAYRPYGNTLTSLCLLPLHFLLYFISFLVIGFVCVLI